MGMRKSDKRVRKSVVDESRASSGRSRSTRRRGTDESGVFEETLGVDLAIIHDATRMLDVSARMQVDRFQRSKPRTLDPLTCIPVLPKESIYGNLGHVLIIRRSRPLCISQRGNVLNVWQRTDREKIIC